MDSQRCVDGGKHRYSEQDTLAKTSERRRDTRNVAMQGDPRSDGTDHGHRIIVADAIRPANRPVVGGRPSERRGASAPGPRSDTDWGRGTVPGRRRATPPSTE